MKNIGSNKLCFYCLGCNKQEDIDYIPKMRCNKFIPGIKDWQEKFREELKNNGKKY